MHLKKITITLGFIVKCLGHWPSIEEILGSSPLDWKFFMIKFSEFIAMVCGKTGMNLDLLGKY